MKNRNPPGQLLVNRGFASVFCANVLFDMGLTKTSISFTFQIHFHFFPPNAMPQCLSSGKTGHCDSNDTCSFRFVPGLQTLPVVSSTYLLIISSISSGQLQHALQFFQTHFLPDIDSDQYLCRVQSVPHTGFDYGRKWEIQSVETDWCIARQHFKSKFCLQNDLSTTLF